MPSFSSSFAKKVASSLLERESREASPSTPPSLPLPLVYAQLCHDEPQLDSALTAQGLRRLAKGVACGELPLCDRFVAGVVAVASSDVQGAAGAELAAAVFLRRPLHVLRAPPGEEAARHFLGTYCSPPPTPPPEVALPPPPPSP
ncbi:hypothetical protein TeGR_g13930, partial [Tetraparma gracilis]